MSHGTDYQRYKHKLERLQCKVKRSENARKELEIRLQRLMKERNECEKTASIHKSKYNTLLNHERKRLNRNEELLQMLEDVQSKAANLASNTERLKLLKNQQERTLINNWRRNACLQQQLFYPNVLYPNAVQYVLPSPPPLASTSSLTTSQPAVITSSHDYQNSAGNVIPGVKPIGVYDSDAIYRNPLEEHTSTIQSFINAPHVVAHQQHPTISQHQQQQQEPFKLSSSLMPIYHSEPFHPLYNNFYIRSHEPLQSSYQETAFTPNRSINRDMTKLYNIEHDPFVHDKKSNSMTPSIDQRPIYNARFPWLLNKSQPLDHHPYYSQIGPSNRTINHYSFDDGSMNSQINETTTPINATSHDQQSRRQQQQQQHGENKSNTDPSIYSGEREMISNANDIDSMNQYERNINDKCNEPFKRNTNNDVYANDNEYKPTHIESIDLRKSISSTAVASTSNVTPSSTTMTTRTADFTLNENAQHIPYSAGTSTFDDVSNQRDHYPYGGDSNRTYTSAHSKDAHLDGDGGKVAVDSISSRTFPSENQQKIIKRRSSIDADSFAKTLGHDINSEKESIAANIRRRYSVAANFLNLASNAENQSNSFSFSPTISANEYQKNTRAWVDNNNTPTTRGHTIQPDEHHIDSIRMHGQSDQSSLDMNAMPRIDNSGNESRNGSAAIARNQIDLPMTSASLHNSPIDSNDAYLSQTNTENPYQDERNVNQYDSGAAPYTTAAYTMDDQTYVENAMEQLKLDENGGQRSGEDTRPVQFDDSADRIRASGKTVTWADDPESNYKKQATANMYEAQSIPDNENSAEQFYANPSNTQQQTQQHDYSTSVDNGPASGANESTHYQYDNSNQYDDGQYQYQQQPDAAGTDDGYYYGTEQMNQYDQYGAQPEVQPQQQEDTQQMQYYTAEPTEISDGIVNDGYQQFQTESALQVPPKQDEYYTVSPGENYYTDYDNETYAAPSNTTNVTGVAAQQTQSHSLNQLQQQPQLQPQPLSNIPKQHEPIHVPNYLQSDTDDSQIGYPNQTTNAAPQSQDSDFDFSTNS